VTFLGLRNNEGVLVSSYCKKENLPEDCRVFKMTDFVPMLKGLNPEQYLLSLATVTTYVKALSGTTLRYVKASPKELHAIAENIDDCPYVLGVSDCHTWFLRAVSEMERYQTCVGKKYGDMAGDTLKCGIGEITKPMVETWCSYTNAAGEVINTGKRLAQGDENPLEVVATGAGDTVNHVIRGSAKATGAGADCTAGVVANLAGMATLGGCATKRGMFADLDDIDESDANIALKVVRGVGVTVGNVGYGAASTVQNVYGGTADTVCNVVSGAAGAVTDSCDIVRDIVGMAEKGEVNPVLAGAAIPFAVVGAVGVRTVKTAGNLVVDLGKTVGGAFQGLGSIFTGRK